VSVVELMSALLFGNIFRFGPGNPGHPNNDRLIFSKGNVSPRFYSLWAAAGQPAETEIMTYRQFGSPSKGIPL